MKIAYLIEDTVLCGGNRVILAQADALIERGHQVVCITKGKPLEWRESKAAWIYVDDFAHVDADLFDRVIATFYTTLEPAWRMAPGRAVHLCQGYEGFISYYAAIVPEIERLYALPLPKMTVSPHLVDVCLRFHPFARCVGQIVDAEFFRERLPAENEPLRLLLAGESQIDLKGISDAYAAIESIREGGIPFDLVRVSTMPPADADLAARPAEFHEAIPAAAMTRLVHSCDAVLAPNHAAEGFGLPAAEAMASGLAAILTKIPSYLSFDTERDYALFAEPGEPADLARQLSTLLSSPSVRRRLQERGREVAGQFRAPRVAEKIEQFLVDAG
jgi:glycosyltransferase involved in cell wall biosynthesis